jgi:hypothetical protein
MKAPIALAILALTFCRPAAAGGDADRREARALMQRALEAQAPLPVSPPRLPVQTSDGARETHEKKPYGPQGADARERAMKAASERGSDLGAEARVQAQIRAREVIDAHAPSAVGASQTAAGQTQTSESKKPKSSGDRR